MKGNALRQSYKIQRKQIYTRGLRSRKRKKFTIYWHMKFRSAFHLLSLPFFGLAAHIFSLRLPFSLQLLNGYTSKKSKFCGFSIITPWKRWPSTPHRTAMKYSFTCHLPPANARGVQVNKFTSQAKAKKCSQINLECQRPLSPAGVQKSLAFREIN